MLRFVRYNYLRDAKYFPRSQETQVHKLMGHSKGRIVLHQYTREFQRKVLHRQCSEVSPQHLSQIFPRRLLSETVPN